MAKTYTTKEIAELIGRSVPHTQRLLKSQGIEPVSHVGMAKIWPASALAAVKQRVSA